MALRDYLGRGAAMARKQRETVRLARGGRLVAAGTSGTPTTGDRLAAVEVAGREEQQLLWQVATRAVAGDSSAAGEVGCGREGRKVRMRLLLRRWARLEGEKEEATSSGGWQRQCCRESWQRKGFAGVDAGSSKSNNGWRPNQFCQRRRTMTEIYRLTTIGNDDEGVVARSRARKGLARSQARKGLWHAYLFIHEETRLKD
ncbi:hypothetical protein BHM03_00055335 [Ensete ventricosum]|nr:hypothetical protein BHM03_00055335 [Ensete ventricosum]